jgi:hypothetical protein
MDANRFSIGDLVRAKTVKWDYEDSDETPPMYISKIDKKEAVLELGGIEYYAFIDDLQPIPITTDFLLNNGFIDNKLGQYYCRVDNVKTIRCGELHPKQWFITVDEVVGDNEYETHAINLTAKYVHELQHLVNDCKLTKEFKI